MYFRYGDYRHEDGEVQLQALDVTSEQTPRGEPLIVRKTMSLGVDLRANGQTAIKRRIDQMERAYSRDFRDAGFHHSNGQRSAHYLTNANSLDGVRVVGGPNFFDVDGAEYATHRSCQIVLQAEYYAEGAPGMIEYQETLRFQGSGGNRKRWIVTDVGPAQQFQTAERTLQQVVQAGFAVGNGAYPLVPPPTFRRELMDEEQSSTTFSPSRIKIGLTFYRVDWQYVFYSDRPLDGRPRVR